MSAGRVQAEGSSLVLLYSPEMPRQKDDPFNLTLWERNQSCASVDGHDLEDNRCPFREGCPGSAIVQLEVHHSVVPVVLHQHIYSKARLRPSQPSCIQPTSRRHNTIVHHAATTSSHNMVRPMPTETPCYLFFVSNLSLIHI